MKFTRRDLFPELALKANPQDKNMNWILSWPDGKGYYAAGKWGSDFVSALACCNITVIRALICGDLGCDPHRRSTGLPVAQVFPNLLGHWKWPPALCRSPSSLQTMQSLISRRYILPLMASRSISNEESSKTKCRCIQPALGENISFVKRIGHKYGRRVRKYPGLYLEIAELGCWVEWLEYQATQAAMSQ